MYMCAIKFRKCALPHMMRLQLMKLLMNRCAKSPEIRAIPSGLPAGTLTKKQPHAKRLSSLPTMILMLIAGAFEKSILTPVKCDS